MNKYIDAEKLKAEVKNLNLATKTYEEQVAFYNALAMVVEIIDSLQQEQAEENKLPKKRTRVNYAICKLQSFKPLREAIVLDDYVYDKDKCYRDNLLNYIHAIPESRLVEVRNYLKEKGWWPYNDDADWSEQEQPEVDLEKEIQKHIKECLDIKFPTTDIELIKKDVAYTARKFYELGKARKEE